MSALGDRLRLSLVAAVLLTVVVGAQAVAFSAAPRGGTSPGELLGKTGFAYLGGLRTFAAAVIWNRIDPQGHEYFEGVTLTDQTFLVPKMRMVTLLDPTFTDAYYVTSWIVYKRIGPEDGVAVAREGLVANPDSGLMRANLVQLLFLQDKAGNRSEIFRYAKLIAAGDSLWKDDEERFEGYATAMHALEDSGEHALAHEIEALLETWRSEGIGLGDHDHDGDGKQDH